MKIGSTASAVSYPLGMWSSWSGYAQGTQEHYYTPQLEDAIIVDIKDYMHNCQDPANSHFTHLEDVHFTYRKITWTHEVCGTSGSDDWRSPIAG
jgi:type VI secretion system secreted protein Hcp